MIESEDKVKRWLFPFANITIKGGQPHNTWPRQKLPERVLLLNAIKEAMDQTGIPQVEIGQFVLDLLQDESIIHSHGSPSSSSEIRSLQPRNGVDHLGHRLASSQSSKGINSRTRTKKRILPSAAVGLSPETLELSQEECKIAPGISSLEHHQARHNTTEVLKKTQRLEEEVLESELPTHIIDNPAQSIAQPNSALSCSKVFDSDLNTRNPGIAQYVSSSQVMPLTRTSTEVNECWEDDEWSGCSDDCSMESFSQDKPLRRKTIKLPKLQTHADMESLLLSLESFFFCSGKRSTTQLQLLKTTLQRLLFYASSKCKDDFNSLSSLEYVVDSSLKTPSIVVEYINAYSAQTDIAATVRNEVNRLRDLIAWRSTLLLIGSADDLTRRQLLEMERFLKCIQSRLQRMVTVRTPEELDEIGMWSSMHTLREAVTKAMEEFNSPTLHWDVEVALKYQTVLIALMYTSCRPQRRSVIANLTVDDLKSSTVTLRKFKTSNVYSFLSWTIPQSTYEAVCKFIQDIRPLIQGNAPPCSFLFLTKSGTKRSISGDIAKFFFSRLGLLISTTRIRQIYRTEAEGQLTEEEKLILDQSDGHSSETVRKHYLKLNKVEQAKKADLLYSKCFDKESLKITEHPN
jgi:hypothetical protein